jgi:hypothetical protein
MASLASSLVQTDSWVEFRDVKSFKVTCSEPAYHYDYVVRSIRYKLCGTLPAGVTTA